MYALMIILLIVVSACLIGVVLIQSGRGDGLAGAFGMGEGQAVFGNRAGDVLTKATTWFAVAFMVLCLAVTWYSKRAGDSVLRWSTTGERRAVGGRGPVMTLAELERMEAAGKTGEVSAVTEAEELGAETNDAVEAAGGSEQGGEGATNAVTQ